MCNLIDALPAAIDKSSNNSHDTIIPYNLRERVSDALDSSLDFFTRSSKTVQSPSLFSALPASACLSLYVCQISGCDGEAARCMRVTWNSGWTRRVCCSCLKNLA